MIIKKDFFLNPNIIDISYNLIGKILISNNDNIITGGIITELEAYEGTTDKASHAWNNRRTKRNQPMYEEGGIAYVYLCYGIHNLFNIVTNKKNIPDAILIRKIFPTIGIDEMYKRRKTNPNKTNIHNLITGPGTTTQALSINLTHNYTNLTNKKTIWLEDHNIKINKNHIQRLPRIGIDYAQEDAKRPNRFLIPNDILKKIYTISPEKVL